MKSGIPAWSAVAIVFKGPRVLAISRNFNPRDPGFPGGDSETFDATPADTARRELFEEAGIDAIALRCVDKWEGERGQPVFAFHVTRWQGSRLRTGDEGKPFWARPQRFLAKTATYSDHAQRLLQMLGKIPPPLGTRVKLQSQP